MGLRERESGTHSFIFVELVDKLGLVSTHKSSLLSIILPNGKTIKCEELYKNCPIRMYEHEFLANLYRFDLTNFGVIVGMDWLARYQTQIDCPKQRITLKEPNGKKVVHKGKASRLGVKLITVMQAHKLLGRRCERFLFDTVKIEAAEPSFEDLSLIHI